MSTPRSVFGSIRNSVFGSKDEFIETIINIVRQYFSDDAIERTTKYISSLSENNAKEAGEIVTHFITVRNENEESSLLKNLLERKSRDELSKIFNKINKLEAAKYKQFKKHNQEGINIAILKIMQEINNLFYYEIDKIKSQLRDSQQVYEQQSKAIHNTYGNSLTPSVSGLSEEEILALQKKTINNERARQSARLSARYGPLEPIEQTSLNGGSKRKSRKTKKSRKSSKSKTSKRTRRH
jgi:hypothetical protein